MSANDNDASRNVVTREWLEADGRGGFASGPVGGPRTRRYHALLLASDGARRFVLVNGAEVEVTTAAGSFHLDVQSWGGARAPVNATDHLETFAPEPWPTWTFRLPDGTRLQQELFAVHGESTTVMSWRLLAREGAPASENAPRGRTPGRDVTLRVRLFFSGRDYHALHHENPAFAFTPRAPAHHDRAETSSFATTFEPYPGVPALEVRSNGRYTHAPLWYRGFHYADEEARGLPAVEDLAAPGTWSFELGAGEAHLCLEARTAGTSSDATHDPRSSTTSMPFSALVAARRAREEERRRAFASPLHRAADAYVVGRSDGGRTIIAGYPWFTDWGRDTFIALRGLCLATGALDDARAILRRWAGVVSDGMLPNRFPDDEGAPEYNAVDAALWYVVAAWELLQTPGAPLSHDDRAHLHAAIEAILSGHARGTRYGIRATADGLLAAGEPGVQLTWMDAKLGDWVVTPRIGKPVEVQALWLNALRIGGELGLPQAPRWRALFAAGQESFRARFWNPGRACLFDVVDEDHESGRADARLRPNQIFAVGGLPFPLLAGEHARAVVDAVEAELLTPLGLRSLGPREPGYCPRYTGDMRSRDGAYHQGTVWPWLLGPFVEAWLRVRGGTAEAKDEARRRFLAPLEAHLGEAGVGHVCEVADAEPPHAPGGCPFQAWSLGELLRLRALVGAARAPQRNVTTETTLAPPLARSPV